VTKFSTSYNLLKEKPINKISSVKKIKSRLFVKNIDKLNQGGLRTKGFFKHKSSKRPLITIITVVKNNEKYLEKTILSVLKQNYKNLEYLIIDGNSKDSTKKIIKKYDKFIDYWVSKKDKGIYDAFNTGLSLSNGDYIGFLNSDDVFTKNAMKHLNIYLKKNYDFIFGSVKKHWGLLHGYKPEKIWYTWGFYTSHSSGFFINHKAMQKVGKYNLKYKYSSDYDYLYRMIVKYKLYGCASKKDEIFGIFRRGGFSSTIPFRKHFLEELKIRYDNNQSIFVLILISIAKIIFNFRNFVTNK
tara:strand:- start:392 stop:1288 length:897 start_codon:yes stop_codon:yes gene_type:complete